MKLKNKGENSVSTANTGLSIFIGSSSPNDSVTAASSAPSAAIPAVEITNISVPVAGVERAIYRHADAAFIEQSVRPGAKRSRFDFKTIRAARTDTLTAKIDKPPYNERDAVIDTATVLRL